jgi:hypothetical protein
MISQIHLRRYQSSGRSLAKRLSVRGMKLLGVFLALNILVMAILLRSPNPGALQRLVVTLVVANPTASEGIKGASFSMLVPIAYLLLLAAGLIAAFQNRKRAFIAMLCTLAAAVAVAAFLGLTSGYLDLLMMGMLGAVLGFSGKDQISAITNRPFLLSILYCGYLIAITFWSVSLPLQIASVILTNAMLYIAGGRMAESHPIQRFTVLLGKYSLLGYIAQIGILQVLRRIVAPARHGSGMLLIVLAAAITLTWAVVEVKHVLRRRSRVIDDLYRFAFA